ATTSYTLTEATPAGGVYSGTGVSNGQFSASTAGLGTHTISYTFTDSESCSATATQTIIVDACAGLSEEDLNYALTVYPNPSTTELNISLSQSSVFVDEIRLISLTGKV